MYIIEDKERELRLKKISIALIALGTLLSQVFLFRFDVTHEIKFTGVWMHFLFPLFKFGNRFDNIIITSAMLGYALFFTFFIIHYKKAKQNHSRFISIGIILCACAIMHEFYIYFRAYLDYFTPEPFFAGIPLLLICIEVFNAVYRPSS